MPSALKLPDLEERFLPPTNWQSGEFYNPKTGHNIHYSFIPAPEQTAKGIVVTLPGLSEYGEKYIETARQLYQQDYGFFVIDWAYQGCSTRFKQNPQKRHSDGYEADISDLNFLIKNIIGTSLPLYMLAHSMGGNIGLRYLMQHPDIFTAASFSAPMLGIQDLKHIGWLVKPFLKALPFLHEKYIPGGKDWHESARKSNGEDIFSHDPIRDQVHNQWCLANPQLQIGNPTFKWIYESLKSISVLKDQKKLRNITIPFLLAVAEFDVLVNNGDIEHAAKIIPDAEFLFLKGAHHEILMETDDIRNKFIDKTLAVFNR
ncbi:MAG TPA: alpha/beta hydrolase [Alphaproteobacteria bacterium]|nr:alpha/beta hydrolase [Alphaproteobacteria bacterium]